MRADNRHLNALILAGGKGSRLQSVVSDRPKPMAEAAGRPFLEWLVLALQRQSVRRVILCTGYKSDVIESHFGNGGKWNMEIEYSQDPKPLGTAGAVRHALDYVDSDRFLVMNGDSYCVFDINRLEKVHSLNNANATIWLVRMEDCSRFGSVAINDNGEVLEFSEKSDRQDPGLINAGIYLFERAAAESIPSGRSVSLELEVLPSLIGKGLFAVRGNGPFIDIGTPESYAESETFFRELT